MTLAWLSGEGWEGVSRRLLELLESHPNLRSESLTELQLYLNLMHHHLQDMQRSLDLFAPWLSRLDAMPAPLTLTPGWQDFRNNLPAELPRLGEAGAVYERIKTSLQHFKMQAQDAAARDWCQKLDDDLTVSAHDGHASVDWFLRSRGTGECHRDNMDFRFLFNERRQVFTSATTPATERLDPSYYDLLASEARIASLIAIAKGDVPQSHWQHLGAAGDGGERQAGIALVERHHVRISHADPVHQKLRRDISLG
jgi:cyclic beta-1,2-glucan synthetase